MVATVSYVPSVLTCRFRTLCSSRDGHGRYWKATADGLDNGAEAPAREKP